MVRIAPRPLTYGVLAAGILCGRGSAAALADDEFLSPGVTAEFDLDVGDVRCHAISLEAGQLLHVEVREKGPRVLLSLLDDSGTTLVRRQAVFFELPTVRLLAIVPATAHIRWRCGRRAKAGLADTRSGWTSRAWLPTATARAWPPMTRLPRPCASRQEALPSTRPP
ncbi:MAG: hypothetical protein DMF81_21000 [Acidobacteria bacterium]|nr:MAG: hypothetical protein DMF81_21000 [Acidobacteriota bacterium]